MSRILWHLKQLLPLKYETTYTEDGQKWRETWRMWFGRCFARKRRCFRRITGEQFRGWIDEAFAQDSRRSPLMALLPEDVED